MKEVQPGTADGADLFSSHGRACFPQTPDPQIHQNGGRKKHCDAQNMDRLQGWDDPARGLDRVTERGRRQPLADIAQDGGIDHSVTDQQASG